MVVIVEGIDRVGKTTLVNKLKDKLGFKIYKHMHKFFPYNKMDTDNETDKAVQLLELYGTIGKSDLVFDRLVWSDVAYGVAQRNYEYDKALNNCRKVEALLNDLDGILVIVQPTDIDRSSKEHGSDLSVQAAIFENMLESTICENVIVCDYDTLDNAVNTIRRLKENMI